MARAKKEAALTPEERLQAASVPDWEWPYKLPENWCWTYVSTAYDVTSSKRVHKEDWLSEGIPFYRTRELVKLSSNGFVDNELYISEEQYETFKREYGVPAVGDLLISGVGTIGVPYVVESHEKFYFKDGNVIWFKNRGLFVPRFIFYLYKSMFMDKQIHDMASGTTVDTYTIINANMTKVPLAPLSEQQRIVDRIESLFAKLDEAKEKAQAVVDSFETRKAAILHKAFSGELTANWREEHGVDFITWSNIPLGLLTDVVSSKRIYKDEYVETGIPFFRSSEVVDLYDTGFTRPEYHISVERYNQIKAQYGVPKVGDLLVTSVGTIGKTWIVDEREFYYKDGNLTQVKQCDALNMRFLQLYIMSAGFTQQVNDTVAGSAYNALTIIKFKQILIPTPSIREQMEIARVLDEILKKEQQAKEAAEAVLDQIDLMKKSILARAFRGELGTNDPADEPAMELLKRIFS